MRTALSIVLVLLLSWPARAEGPDTQAIIETHIVPGYRELADAASELANAAATGCAPDRPELIETYHRAFDAWIGVSHLRFGPSETDNRAFALAFWPDPRGSAPKALSALIRAEDDAVSDADAYAAVSVAARGFYALEYLLFDTRFADAGTAEYRCALIGAIARDIEISSAAIRDDWQNDYGTMMLNPGGGAYRTSAEVAQQFFTALVTGLEFTADTRLGRPMGTFDRPRPNRAEARRSGRSLRHVVLSLRATGELAALISMDHPGLGQAFDNALQRATALNDPVFAGVADTQGRLRVELLQQDINVIRQILVEQIGPGLGIAAGFNALDGD